MSDDKTTARRLSVAPEPSPCAELEHAEAEHAEAAAWLRRMMGMSRDLCEALDRYLGPDHPAPRPQLTVIRGGRAGDDQ